MQRGRHLGAWLTAGLGALAVLWYNGVYTYLKRRTSLASVIGSVIGAIPHAIGWVCAGGVLDGPILSLSFFLLMWQVPHFWLLAMRLDNDYERASFPTFVRAMGADSVSRVTFMWTAATAASALLLPIFGLSTSPFLGLGQSPHLQGPRRRCLSFPGTLPSYQPSCRSPRRAP